MAEAHNGTTELIDKLARLPGLQKTCVCTSTYQHARTHTFAKTHTHVSKPACGTRRRGLAAARPVSTLTRVTRNQPRSYGLFTGPSETRLSRCASFL